MKTRSPTRQTTGNSHSIEEMLKNALRDLVLETQRAKSEVLGPPKEDDTWPELFVLMPFRDSLKPVYRSIVSVSKQEKLRGCRASNFLGSEMIMQDVWSAINAAQIIVADCTGRNPNVMYEIGLAHAIGKYTILMAQSIRDMPFNLRHLRCIIYSDSPSGMIELRKKLRKFIRARGTRVA